MTPPNNSRSELRWSDYVLARGAAEVEALWTATAVPDRDALYVLAEGFDPRTLTGVKRFLVTHGATRTTVLSLGMPPAHNATAQAMAQQNTRELSALTSTTGARLLQLPYPPVSESRAAGQKIAAQVILGKHLDAPGLVVIDVSAMPTAVHFALIGAVLQYCPQRKDRPDVQVVVCENPELDAAIVNVGTGPADTIGGFMSGLDLEARSQQLRIWAPVLGPGEAVALRSLFDRLEAREICPVLPFPSGNPRLADDLLLEYRSLLFETMGVDPRDFIYADERNPFDLYRTLSRLNARYREALEQPLGEVKVILSAHSSKLMSLGVLLAAHEHALPVVSAPPTSYDLAPGFTHDRFAQHDQLVCLWLEGSPYQ
jgi:hypothetical protein